MNSRLFFHRHTFGALVGVLGVVCSGRFHISQQKELSTISYQLTAPFFRFVTAGFWPAAVDALWIRTIQNIGTASYAPVTLRATREFYQLASDLDPNFYELYEQGGVLFLFFYESADAAEEILNKGIRVYEAGGAPEKFWTHPYTLYIFLANVYAFQKNDWTKAKEAFLRAADVPGAPQYLRGMQSWLQKEGSEKVLARKTLEILINNSEDEIIRKKYQEMLKKYEK